MTQYTYGSESFSTNRYMPCSTVSSVRRTFLLFALFDLFLTFILWVIYTQVSNNKGMDYCIMSDSDLNSLCISYLWVSLSSRNKYWERGSITICMNTVNWLLFVRYQFSPFSSVPSMTNLRTDEYMVNTTDFIKTTLIL